MHKKSLKLLLCLAVDLVLVGCILFGEWISVNYYLGTTGTGLVEIYKFLSRITNYISTSDYDGVMILVGILVYAFLAFGIWVIWDTLSDAFHGNCSSSLCSYAIILSATIILIVFLTNLAIEKEIDLGDIFGISSGCYITLALGIFGRLLIDKMPDDVQIPCEDRLETMKSSVISVLSGSEPAVAKASDEVVAHEAKTETMPYCPKCGKAAKDKESAFCSNCGTKLITDIVCNSCGKKLDVTVHFCPSCGTENLLYKPE